MPRTATLEELFFRLTEGDGAGGREPAGSRMTAPRPAGDARVRAGARRGTVYRWELRKLVAQKRTYLGLGVAIALPLIFVAALLADRAAGPTRSRSARYVRETGLADPARRACSSARSGCSR